MTSPRNLPDSTISGRVTLIRSHGIFSLAIE